MNVATMRKADRWLGVPTCWALTVLARLKGSTWWHRFPTCAAQGRGHRLKTCATRRILFVKLAEQGSTVLAAPAIERAVALVGRENVFFACFAENRFILDVMELIPPENVFAISTGGIFSTVASAIGCARRLRKAEIDAAIDLEFFARSSAALCYLSGAKWRVGFHAFGGEASWRGDLMTHRLSFNPHLHTAQTFQTMVQALAAPPGDLPAFDIQPPALKESNQRFKPTAREADEVRQIVLEASDFRLRASGVGLQASGFGQQASGAVLGPAAVPEARSPRPEAFPEACSPMPEAPFPSLILLNPNCSDLLPVRSWPAQRYVELARRLVDKYADVRVAFTSAPAEAEATETLAQAVGSDRVISLAGKTTLRQLLVLYTLGEVLVTNDSGPAHFAALTPIDVVVLFGPETPRLFAAPSPRTHVVYRGIACSPCVNAYNNRLWPCHNNLCMQGISVEQVFEEVSRVFEQRQRDCRLPIANCRLDKDGTPGRAAGGGTR